MKNINVFHSVLNTMYNFFFFGGEASENTGKKKSELWPDEVSKNITYC